MALKPEATGLGTLFSFESKEKRLKRHARRIGSTKSGLKHVLRGIGTSAVAESTTSRAESR